jgi:hypothetical protein
VVVWKGPLRLHLWSCCIRMHLSLGHLLAYGSYNVCRCDGATARSSTTKFLLYPHIWSIIFSTGLLYSTSRLYILGWHHLANGLVLRLCNNHSCDRMVHIQLQCNVLRRWSDERDAAFGGIPAGLVLWIVWYYGNFQLQGKWRIASNNCCWTTWASTLNSTHEL